jgi:hypothetical protein
MDPLQPIYSIPMQTSNQIVVNEANKFKNFSKIYSFFSKI